MNALPSPARAPLALAATAFAGGILLAAHLQRPPWLWVCAGFLLGLCALAAVAKSNLHLAHFSVALALVFAGAFAQGVAPVARVVFPPQQFLYREVQVAGHITNDVWLLAGSGPRQRFDLDTESIEFTDDNGREQQFLLPIGMRVTMYSRGSAGYDDEQEQPPTAAAIPELAYGQRISFATKLRLPRNFRNPGAFDYEGYLHGFGLSAIGSVDAAKIQILPGRVESWPAFWRSAVRRSVLSHIAAKGLWNREDAALLSAMVIGNDSLLLRNVRDEFQETGVYHLLVVSGMNVGILAFAIFWLARRLRAPDWIASLITIALAAFYAYIAGMGVPIQRAVLMLALFLLARLFYRGRAPLNAAGFAALVVLVLTPHALFEAGFQLTFLALVAIFGISLPLLECTSEPCRNALRHLDSTAYDLHLPPRMAQLRLDLRLIAGRLARFISATPAQWLVTGGLSTVFLLYEFTVVSLISQAVLVVPMRVYFHRAAILGIPANVLALPLAGVLLNSAVVAIALSYFSLALARIPAVIASACLHWTLASITWLSRLHISQWRIPEAGPGIWLVAVIAITIALLAVRRRPIAAVAGLCVLFLSTGFAALARTTPSGDHGVLEVTAIDVGQGDSILVVAPDGATMLIDGGGSIGPVHSEFDFGEDVVSPYLWWRGLDHLDVVVLTHAHGDHIGGLSRIVQNFHPREVWMGINPETPALDHFLVVDAENHAAMKRHTAGETLQWHGTEIRVLSPPADWQPKKEPKNDDSLALLVSYKSTSALLAGDLEKKMERFVAAESPRADVLKVAHHGSATSTTQELLDAVHPRFAAISVGWHNSFGHPRLDVLQRLQAAHVRTYRTDMLGLISFFLDGKTVTVKTAQDF
ncbi:MAG TPA: DNA internalization-related competence protein ComEC/Rec2 [Candidatus Angelobacter sp.]|nr:DNA internalization-related competence protein ComEC/Rec2 [Candidatus Angelobacter sp.]